MKKINLVNHRDRIPTQPNQSLINGIELLMQLVAAKGPLGCRELARKMGIEHTKVSRLLGTLAHIGMSDRTEPSRKYIPGPAIHILAALALKGSRLLQVSIPLIMELTNKTGYMAALGLLWKDQVVYLFHSKSLQEKEIGIAGHDLYPAEISSIGLALLAHKTNKQIRQCFQTVTAIERKVDMKKLLRDINIVRKNGYSCLRGQNYTPLGEEIKSICVGIGDSPIAGLAVMGQVKNKRELKKVVELMKQAAQQVAEAVSY